MAELVDALASGASDRKVVEVQVLFWAPQILTNSKTYNLPVCPDLDYPGQLANNTLMQTKKLELTNLGLSSMPVLSKLNRLILQTDPNWHPYATHTHNL